jgi:cytochrome P450 family 142 subfamily A polypeptide 1
MADHPTRPEIQLTEGAFYANDPDPLYAWMRANAPVYWDETGQVWGISRYADLKRVSKDPATFSNAGGIRPGFPPLPMMIDMDDPDHWNRRKLVNRGFTPRRVRDQEGKIEEACDYIIDRVCERGSADLVRDIAAPLPMIMIGDSLGVAPEDRDDLLRWSDDMVKGQSASATEEMFLTAGKAFADYTAYAADVIAKRRVEPHDDLMSELVNAEVDGDRLTDEEIIQEALLILVGGDETTRHVISEGVYQLLRHPDQWQKLADDRTLLTTAIEELLRWVSPIKNMARTVTTDVELGGQQLQAGEELLLLYASANRDEAAFDHPERFDVERDPNEHVAFGFGSHFCLGNSLARLEIKVMLDKLLTRLPDLALALPDGAAPRFRPANFIVGPEELPVTFSPSEPVGASA